MDSRLRFRPRISHVERPGDPGTKRQRFCGLTAKGRRLGHTSRDLMTRCGGNPKPSVVESAGKKSPVGSVLCVRTVNRHR